MALEEVRSHTILEFDIIRKEVRYNPINHLDSESVKTEKGKIGYWQTQARKSVSTTD
jgi:hypothetical protein